MTAALSQLINTVRANSEPDGLNDGVNDAAAAGQTAPHLHWHNIPRYEGDVENPVGGVRGVIPEKQKY
jgi:diadenosine tetraphosphate (Ap4A) HIT family hydrolase